MAKTKEMIRAILDAGVLDQQRLAEKLEVSPAQITRWLNTGAQPRLNHYEKLEELYEKIIKGGEKWD